MIETTADETPVTRAELMRAIRLAFDAGGVSRDALVAAALGVGARPAVLDTIRTLPNDTVRGPRELWAHLPDLPVR